MAGTSQGRTVLCVDDDPGLLRMMRTFLEVYGYRVFTESDGMAALRVAATEPIDAVITDFHMPGLSGENLCREIRRVKPQVPILMFTGSPATLPPGVRPLVDVLLSKDQHIADVAAALECSVSVRSHGVRLIATELATVPETNAIEHEAAQRMDKAAITPTLRL